MFQAYNLFPHLSVLDNVALAPRRVLGRSRDQAEPEVLLFDEITSALDPELVGEVLDVVGDLKERGFTILMATHEMDFARHAADQVCFLENGVIRERGGAEQVLTGPREAATQRFLARLLNR